MTWTCCNTRLGMYHCPRCGKRAGSRIAELQADNAALREEVEDAQRRINEFCDDAERRYKIRLADTAETLDVALETIRDMRSYLRAEWDWKYGPEWDERERRIRALLARMRGEETT